MAKACFSFSRFNDTDNFTYTFEKVKPRYENQLYLVSKDYISTQRGIREGENFQTYKLCWKLIRITTAFL